MPKLYVLQQDVTTATKKARAMCIFEYWVEFEISVSWYLLLDYVGVN